MSHDNSQSSSIMTQVLVFRCSLLRRSKLIAPMTSKWTMKYCRSASLMSSSAMKIFAGILEMGEELLSSAGKVTSSTVPLKSSRAADRN